MVSYRKTWPIDLIACFIAFALPGSASAQTVQGIGSAIDGDSLMVGPVEVRLFGIDAPELIQTCAREGLIVECGREARGALGGMVDGLRVECEGRGQDVNQRLLAVCQVGGRNINAAMVQSGWAMAFTRYSTAYRPAEAAARSSGAGIWSTDFVPPWTYRAQAQAGRSTSPARAMKAPEARPKPPAGCTIKGNRSRRGELIYHLPGRPYYDQTSAERMFCTEEEAQRAGFRRSKA